MYEFSPENKEDMYTLGLLHDVGKSKGVSGHEEKGAEILKSVGFKYYKEVYYHGRVQDEYSSEALDILNMADLTVNAFGDVVGFAARLLDIGERYGKDSIQYKNAEALIKSLSAKGIVYKR